MNAHRIETALTEDGKLLIQNLPFNKGDQVEIIILERNSAKNNAEASPLKGKVISYEDPFDPTISVNGR